MTRTVVFVNRAGRVSGAETVLLKLIDVAVTRGYRVRVVCPPGSLAERLPAGVEHLPISELDLDGNSGWRRIAAMFVVAARWFRAGKVIRRTAGDDGAVIVNSLLALPAARMARLSVGVSWLVHDTVSETQQKALIRFSRRAIRRGVAVSPPTAEPVRALGIRIAIAPLGVDIPADGGERPSNAIPVVGIMGVLTPWKGHRVLLQALTKLPEVRCEIAGSAFHADERYVDELRNLATESALAGRVEFLGHVDSISTIRNWDVLVSASTSPEAGPIVALEAMVLGVPVVGTDHGGCAWLLRDGAGMLVAPGDPDGLADALAHVLNNPDERVLMTQRARRRALDDHDSSATFPAMLDALLDAAG